MNSQTFANRKQRRALAAENLRYADEFVPIPRSDWPLGSPRGLVKVWRSRDFLVQLYGHEAAPRISVNRTSVKGERFTDEISWDELQRIKSGVGFGDKCAVEIFPPDANVINVANMRHLWLVPCPEYMWR